MVSFGSSKSKGSSSQRFAQEQSPYAPAVPFVEDILNQAGEYQPGATGAQTDAFASLKDKVSGGNPYAGDIDQLARDLFASPSYAADAGQGLEEYRSNLSGIVDENPNPLENDFLAPALRSVGDRASKDLNRYFTGTGAQLSPDHARALGQGISDAQSPLILDQYNKSQDRRAGAAGDLFRAHTGTATQQAQLDSITAGLRQAGIGAGSAALQADQYGENQLLNLEQQEKDLPLLDLASQSSLVFPAAGLGGSASGEGSGSSLSKGKSFGFSLSDERVKENIKPIGNADNGTKLYTYNYKGSTEPQIGPMAQDLVSTKPETVALGDDGLLYVDIRKALKGSKKHG